MRRSTSVPEGARVPLPGDTLAAESVSSLLAQLMGDCASHRSLALFVAVHARLHLHLLPKLHVGLLLHRPWIDPENRCGLREGLRGWLVLERY